MGSILDISDRRRVEELNRQQEEKLQSSARLATMGELASMLAHELNQPLAAISSYTTGALNVLGRAADQGAAVDAALLKPALEQANAQAQRAGQIIRSVHGFVKKRAPQRGHLRTADKRPAAQSNQALGAGTYRAIACLFFLTPPRTKSTAAASPSRQ